MVKLVITGGTFKELGKELNENILQAVKKKFEYVTSGKYVRDLAKAVSAIVIERTLNGTDGRGSRFPEYSTGYLRRKKRKGKYRNVVDLYLTGKMLNSMEERVTGNLTAKVTFPNTSHPDSKLSMYDLAELHNSGKGHQPMREFMAWQSGSDADRKLIRISERLITESITKGFTDPKLMIQRKTLT